MFVIQTRNYILKCVNSSVLFTEMACDILAGSVSPGLDAPRVTGSFPNTPCLSSGAPLCKTTSVPTTFENDCMPLLYNITL
jgi:hypothetical protein